MLYGSININPLPPAHSFISPKRNDSNATAAFVSGLRANSTQLMALAMTQLPAFGVDPSSVRAVQLNQTGVRLQPGENSTNQTYIIDIQFTATIGSTAFSPAISTTSVGRRRALAGTSPQPSDREGGTPGGPASSVDDPSLTSVLLPQAIGLYLDLDRWSGPRAREDGHRGTGSHTQRRKALMVGGDDGSKSVSGSTGLDHKPASNLGPMAVARAAVEGLYATLRQETARPLMGLVASLVEILGGSCAMEDGDANGVNSSGPAIVADASRALCVASNFDEVNGRSGALTCPASASPATERALESVQDVPSGGFSRGRSSRSRLVCRETSREEAQSQRRRLLDSCGSGLSAPASSSGSGAGSIVSASNPSSSCGSSSPSTEAVLMAEIAGAVTGIQEAVTAIQVGSFMMDSLLKSGCAALNSTMPHSSAELAKRHDLCHSPSCVKVRCV